MTASRCDRCDGTGWEPVIDQGVRRVRRCLCWQAAHPSRVVGIPAFFERARLETFERRPGTESALGAAARWLKGAHDLYLGGAVGSGKSRLACSLANEGGRQAVTAAFFDIADLLERARKAEFTDQDLVDPLALARQVDVLVLDDLGALEKTSDYTLRTLLGIYNLRLSHQRRTIWTGNHGLDALSQVLQDDRLTSRIAGAAEVVWIAAADYRVTGEKPWRQSA